MRRLADGAGPQGAGPGLQHRHCPDVAPGPGSRLDPGAGGRPAGRRRRRSRHPQPAHRGGGHRRYGGVRRLPGRHRRSRSRADREPAGVPRARAHGRGRRVDRGSRHGGGPRLPRRAPRPRAASRHPAAGLHPLPPAPAGVRGAARARRERRGLGLHHGSGPRGSARRPPGAQRPPDGNPARGRTGSRPPATPRRSQPSPSDCSATGSRRSRLSISKPRRRPAPTRLPA